MWVFHTCASRYSFNGVWETSLHRSLHSSDFSSRNAVIWMIFSIFLLISDSSSLLSSSLVTVRSVPIAIGVTLTFMPHPSGKIFVFVDIFAFLKFLIVCLNSKIHLMTISTGIRWSVLSQNLREFSETDSGLYILHLSVWSNLHLLHNSQWTPFTTHCT